MLLELFNDFLITSGILVVLYIVIKILNVRFNSIIEYLGLLLYALFVVFLADDFFSPLILLCYFFSLQLSLSLWRCHFWLRLV
jgi:hypothetical protein